MNTKHIWSWIVLLSFVFACTSENEATQEDTTQNQKDTIAVEEEPAKDYQRIVVIGSPLAEIVFELGDTSKIVAYDRKLPFDTTFIRPKVGYKGTLKAYNILSHQPDLVLSDDEGSPQNIIDSVSISEVDYFTYPQMKSMEEATTVIQEIGKLLQKEEQANTLIDSMNLKLTEIENIKANVKDTVSILYIKAISRDNIMVAGNSTPTEAFISLSGAVNAGDVYDGYQRLDEEVSQLVNPNYILLSQESWEKMGGVMFANTVPELLQFAAYRTGRILILPENDIEGFGVNTPQEALEFAQRLYGK